MPIISQSSLMPHSQASLFHLINQVDNYPHFMPFCTQAKVLEKNEKQIVACITLQKGPLKESFTTKNDLYPHEKMVLHLVQGPFKHLEGCWTFEEKSKETTLVTLHLDYEFSSFMISCVFGALFKKAAHDLIESFNHFAKKALKP
jgi:ribosome-associated toxin RatA of RatAB toxin-antitoxin module